MALFNDIKLLTTGRLATVYEVFFFAFTCSIVRSVTICITISIITMIFCSVSDGTAEHDRSMYLFTVMVSK